MHACISSPDTSGFLAASSVGDERILSTFHVDPLFATSTVWTFSGSTWQLMNTKLFKYLYSNYLTFMPSATEFSSVGPLPNER